MACSFCNTQIYCKVTRYARPVAAPLTKAEELRHQLLDLTGEEYVLVAAPFCPMCGEKKEV
jgi:hypothetical protein